MASLKIPDHKKPANSKMLAGKKGGHPAPLIDVFDTLGYSIRKFSDTKLSGDNPGSNTRQLQT
jgi:hypothetical protein